MSLTSSLDLSLYHLFSKEQWIAFRCEALSEEDLYPQDQVLQRTLARFFLEKWEKRGGEKRPFLIGVTGSVAVGKSTFTQHLLSILGHFGQRAERMSTDGFLYPKHILEQKHLMDRKGFPESYDAPLLLAFLQDLHKGTKVIEAPLYSHRLYDRMLDRQRRLENVDILIIEGVNLLASHTTPHMAFSPGDFLDLSLYLHAEERDLERWYVARFLSLYAQAHNDPSSYFHRYAHLTSSQAQEMAQEIWTRINLKNLREHIFPVHPRADLLLRKDSCHIIQEIGVKPHLLS